MCFEIRKARLSDMGAAMQLDRETFGVDAWSILDFTGLFSFREIKKFSAFVDGKFAGFAASEYDHSHEAVCLMTIAVRPEYRNRGIGSALLIRCEEAFDAHRFRLNVDIENHSAIRFYQQAGYHQTGIDKAYYLNGHDALIMEKSTE